MILRFRACRARSVARQKGRAAGLAQQTLNPDSLTFGEKRPNESCWPICAAMSWSTPGHSTYAKASSVLELIRRYEFLTQCRKRS